MLCFFIAITLSPYDEHSFVQVDLLGSDGHLSLGGEAGVAVGLTGRNGSGML